MTTTPKHDWFLTRLWDGPTEDSKETVKKMSPDGSEMHVPGGLVLRRKKKRIHRKR